MPLLEHLEKAIIFENIIRAGSLRKAAKELRISQPSLSRTLAILERECSSALVLRSRSGLVLTGAGQKFLNYARSLRESTETLSQDLAEESTQYRGTLSLGTYESISVYLFPFFIKKIQERQKKLKLILKTSSSAELMEELQLNRLDIAVSVNPKRHKSLIHHPLYEDNYGFFRAKSLSPHEKLTLLIVRNAADKSGKRVEDFLRSFKMQRLDWIDCAGFESVKALTLAGVGVGVLPEKVAKPLLDDGTLVQTSCTSAPKTFGQHEVALSYLKSRESDSLVMWIGNELKNFLHQKFISNRFSLRN